MTGPSATASEVAELLGDRVDDAIVERLVATGASIDDIAEAIDEIEHEVRFSERRLPPSVVVAEVRTVLEDVPFDDDDHAGMTLGEREHHAH